MTTIMSFISATMALLLLLMSHFHPTKAEKTPNDFLVKGLEEIEPAFGTFQGDMYAGLLSIDEKETGKLMFWLFEPSAPTVDDSLVIWYNGGPGCSSLDAGLLFEHGPVTIPHHPAGFFGGSAKHDAKFFPNKYSWSNASTIMYVEQPVGTGFSYGKHEPQTEHDVSRDFYHFLQNFYNIFDHYKEKRLYLVGESYAGMYVPSMAHYIYQENSKKHSQHVNLHGIGLGNGWVDVMTQGPMVIDFAWWHGMIDSVTRDALWQEWNHCKSSYKQPDPFHSFTVPDECGIMGAVLTASGAGMFPDSSPNTYDVTTWDKYEVLTGLNTSFTHFFNNVQVQKALHVSPDKPWAGCIPGSGRRRRRLLMLDNDKPISVIPYIATLLDKAKIQVLIYNGDRDMSTCAQGSEVALNNMKWSGSRQWTNPQAYKRGLWMVKDEVAGYSKLLQNLEFVVVYNSGHLVPFNQPKHGLDLITRLVSKQDFCDKEIAPVYETKKKTKNNNHNSGGMPPFAAGLVGFLAGIAAVWVYSMVHRQTRRRYEQLGDVEVE